MFIRRQLTQPSVRAGLFSQAARAFGPSSPQTFHSLSGYLVESTKAHMSHSSGFFHLGRLCVNSSCVKVNGNISLPCAMSMRSLIHSGNPKEFEAEGIPRTPNIGAKLVDRNGSLVMDDFQLSRYNVEQNADIVHIKMLRNNTFVTVTDSNGNKKFGVSAGKLTDRAGKVSRYAAEASAEQVGRDIRGRGIKSIVVKVNGFTMFKKKKQAILGLREGYSHHRGDRNPIVYVEDTTRRPHNGCRLRKKRRV